MSAVFRDLMVGFVLLLVGAVSMLIGHTFVEQGIDAETGAALGFAGYTSLYLAIYYAFNVVADAFEDWRARTAVRAAGAAFFAVDFLTYSRVPALGDLNGSVQAIALIAGLGLLVVAAVAVPPVSDALEQRLTNLGVIEA